MKETIKLDIIDIVNDEGILEFEYDMDVIEVKFNGEKICLLDWNSNLKIAIKRMLELW